MPVSSKLGGRRTGPPDELPEITLIQSTLNTRGSPRKDGLAVIVSSCCPGLRPFARY